MPQPIIYEWICLKCEAEGIGDAERIDADAERHTKETTHPTFTRIAPDDESA